MTNLSTNYLKESKEKPHNKCVVKKLTLINKLSFIYGALRRLCSLFVVYQESLKDTLIALSKIFHHFLLMATTCIPTIISIIISAIINVKI